MTKFIEMGHKVRRDHAVPPKEPAKKCWETIPIDRAGE